MSSDQFPPNRDVFSGWGIIVGGLIGLLPALILGGRWWSVPLFLGVAGWLIGALMDRART